jgi:hypothetical protein
VLHAHRKREQRQRQSSRVKNSDPALGQRLCDLTAICLPRYAASTLFRLLPVLIEWQGES